MWRGRGTAWAVLSVGHFHTMKLSNSNWSEPNVPMTPKVLSCAQLSSLVENLSCSATRLSTL